MKSQAFNRFRLNSSRPFSTEGIFGCRTYQWESNDFKESGRTTLENRSEYKSLKSVVLKDVIICETYDRTTGITLTIGRTQLELDRLDGSLCNS